MAIYRQVYTTFWNDDAKVVDDFTPEDKYFYLYLLTNPHTTLSGVYEISEKSMARETGYNEDTVKRLRDRMAEVHKVICYDPNTKEILLLNWHKYNWTSSDKLRAAIEKQIPQIKTDAFRNYVFSLLNGDTVSIPYPYPMDTPVTNTVTVSVLNKDSNKKKIKHKYGEYKNVLLTDEEVEKLKNKYPSDWELRIKELDEGIEQYGYSYKNHYLTIIKWGEKHSKEKAKPQTELGYSMKSVRLEDFK